MFIPDPAADAPGTVNKTDLATLLRTSLPTLDRLLRQHGDNFPTVRRGTNGLEYQFDPAAVVAFLQQIEDANKAAGRARDELMQQYQLPGVADPTEAALKPRDLLNLAKLRQIERDEQIQAGFLVRTDHIRAALYTAFATLRRDMSAAIRQSCRDANIPEAVTRAIEGRFADAQRSFVQATKTALQNTDTDDGAEPALLL